LQSIVKDDTSLNEFKTKNLQQRRSLIIARLSSRSSDLKKKFVKKIIGSVSPKPVNSQEELTFLILDNLGNFEICQFLLLAEGESVTLGKVHRKIHHLFSMFFLRKNTREALTGRPEGSRG